MISARFKYSPHSFILPPLSCSLQYVIPDSVAALLSNLTNSDIKNDPRIISYSSAYAKLIAAVAEMSKLQENEPGWFGNSHRRVPRQAAITSKRQRNVTDEMDRLVDASLDEEKPVNNDMRVLQKSAQSKTPLNCPQEFELIASETNLTSTSSVMVLESRTSENVMETGSLVESGQLNNRHKSIPRTSGHLNNFMMNADNSGKPAFADENALHDSGFISEKDFTNT